MSQKCTNCNKDFNYCGQSYYCCDPKEFCCLNCSLLRCKKCNKYRQLTHSRLSQFDKDLKYSIMSKVECQNCRRSTYFDKQFFKDKKCGKFYCSNCLRIAFRNYWMVVQELKKDDGENVEIQMQLPCGCFHDKREIISFLKDFCVSCERKMILEGIELKTQERLQHSCYNLMKQSSHRLQYGQNILKARQIMELIRTCSSCSKIIDNFKTKIGNEIDSLYICLSCLLQAQRHEKNSKIHQKEAEAQIQKQKKNVQNVSQIQKNPVSHCIYCETEITQEKKSNYHDTCYDCWRKYSDSANQKKKQGESSNRVKLFAQLQMNGQDSHLLSKLNDKIQSLNIQIQSKSRKQRKQSETIQSANMNTSQQKTQIDAQEIKSIEKDKIQFFLGNQKSLKQIADNPLELKLEIDLKDLSDFKICVQCKVSRSKLDMLTVVKNDQFDNKSTYLIFEEGNENIPQKKIIIYCKFCYFELRMKQDKMKDSFLDSTRSQYKSDRYQFRSTHKAYNSNVLRDSFVSYTDKKQFGKTSFISQFQRKNERLLHASQIKAETDKFFSHLRKCRICLKMTNQNEYNLFLRQCKDCSNRQRLQRSKLIQNKKNLCRGCKQTCETTRFNPTFQMCKTCMVMLHQK